MNQWFQFPFQKKSIQNQGHLLIVEKSSLTWEIFVQPAHDVAYLLRLGPWKNAVTNEAFLK